MEIIKRFINRREATSIIFLLLLFAAVGMVNPTFLEADNIMLCLNGAAVYTICAIGMAFVIFTGEIDASIGATLGLSAAVAATMVRDGSGFMAAVVAAVVIGIVIGLINGIGVAVLRVPSIIMTIGVCSIVRGLSYVYTGGAWVENVPKEFKDLSQLGLGGLSWMYIGTILVMLAVYLFVTKTKHGKYFHTVGDNAEGATHLGIPVNKTRLISFVICAVCASLAAVVFVSRIGFVTPTSGNGYEMKAIAACVIGGISLSGGIGNVIGATFGALIMASISRILVFLGFSSNYDNTITGILLITIVVFDAIMQHRNAERARRERLAARTEEVVESKMAGGNI